MSCFYHVKVRVKIFSASNWHFSLVIVFATIGCAIFSNWRRISYWLLIEKFGKQRNDGKWWKLSFILIGQSIVSSLLTFPCLLFSKMFLIILLQIKPRYAFKRKETRPGEFQVFDDFIGFLFFVFNAHNSFIIGIIIQSSCFFPHLLCVDFLLCMEPQLYSTHMVRLLASFMREV